MERGTIWMLDGSRWAGRVDVNTGIATVTGRGRGKCKVSVKRGRLDNKPAHPREWVEVAK